MRTVTGDYKATVLKQTNVICPRVSYKRRYYYGGGFTWETSWTPLNEDEVVSIGSITSQLDKEKLSEFRFSNLALTLRNEQRQWNWNSVGGKFGIVGGVTYEPYLTKFKIESGVETVAGKVYVDMFVGLLDSIKVSSDIDEIVFNLVGNELLLERSNAENVSTTVTLETLGTGNGSNKDFTTAQPGVGFVSYVEIAGVEKKTGVDFQISQLNDPTLGAKISFGTAPANGAVVKATYKYWKQNQKIDSLVKDLLTSANIPTVNQLVDSVSFSTLVPVNFSWDSQGEFQAGTYTNIDTTTTPGSLIPDVPATATTLLDDFTDGNYTSNPSWTPSNGVWSVVSGKLRMSGNPASARLTTSCNRIFGKWSMDIYCSTHPEVASFILYAGVNNYGGYIVDAIVAKIDGPNGKVQLYEIINDNWTKLAEANYSLPSATTVNLAVKKKHNKTATVEINGSQVLTATYQYSGAGLIYIESSIASNGYGTYTEIDNVNIPTESSYALDWTSDVKDCATTPSQWGVVSLTNTLEDDASLTVSTRSSTDGVSWDAYVNCSPSGQINSALKRYLQVKITITIPNYGSVSDFPRSYSTRTKIDKITAGATTSTVLVRLANFTGKSVYDAISDLATISNYEFGFDSSENFFFRSKDVSLNIDEVLDYRTNILNIPTIFPDYSRVYSDVKAEFGSYVRIQSDSNTGETSVRNRFRENVFSVDGNGMLISPDFDIADGIAKSFLARYGKLRVTGKVQTKLLPWLELGDTVSITYMDKTPRINWKWGDGTVYYTASAGKDVLYYGENVETANNLICKIIGCRHDLYGNVSEFDFEEAI